MTITREQLELAAKAAGFAYRYVQQKSYIRCDTGYEIWAPNVYHGQLLDLAMACGIDLMPSVGGIRYWTKRQPTQVIWVNVDCQDFPALAEAVIFAAAEQQLAKENGE